MAPAFELCRDDAERARLLDLSRRLRRIEPYAIGLYAVAGVAGIPLFGWQTMLPPAFAGAVFWFMQARLTRYRRPEWVIAGCWLLAQLMVAAGVALAHGPRALEMSMFVFPMTLVAVVFPPRAVVVAAAITVALVIATGLGFDAHAIAISPPTLFWSIAIVLGAAIPAAAIRSVDVKSRRAAVADVLTGGLNRVALRARVAELEHQTGLTGEPVAVVLGDVDKFKAVNDRYGHAHGDTVLKAVSSRLRDCLGPFEPIYRFGGEEFVVLVAGADTARGAQIAERLREAVHDVRVGGCGVTMSFGAAASAAGDTFDFEEVFGRADAALYEAKRQGRDCVRTAPAVRAAAPASPGRRVGDEPQARTRSTEARGGGLQDRLAHERATSGSWLVRDALARDHMLDLQRRLWQTNQGAFALVFAAMLASGPWFGFVPVIPMVVGSLVYAVVERRIERFRRPEYVLAAAWLQLQALGTVGFALVHGRPLIALPLMVLLVVGSSAVFPVRGVVVGVIATAVVIVIAAIEVDAHRFFEHPAVVAPALGLLGAIGFIGVAVGRSSVDHRGAAVVDQLTGMLNRAALDARIAELAQQTAHSGQQVSVLVVDVDRFKLVNDAEGHAAGDAVLKEVAYRIRKHLRTFEAVYRFGGDEFVVLLPGVDVDTARSLAERLRNAVNEAPIEGIDVAISAGVAGSADSTPFDFGAVFSHADAALYDAKRFGRDQVRVRLGAGEPAFAA